MDDNRLIEVHGMITDFWKAYKTYYPEMKDEDAWWEQMIGAMSDITEKHKNDPLALAIAGACIGDLERICKKVSA